MNQNEVFCVFRYLGGLFGAAGTGSSLFGASASSGGGGGLFGAASAGAAKDLLRTV